MAGTVSVLVPYRGDDGGPRDRAWEYVRRWWEDSCPGWQIKQGACQPGPWVKASAVAEALARSDGDILVCADSDVLCDGVKAAVEAVQSGAARWAVPHRRVYRLTPAATERVLAGEPMPEPAPGGPARPAARSAHQRRRSREWRAPDFAGIHTGAVGGGLTVLPRALYEEIPLDPRYAGWGQEDTSWGDALTVLAGKPWRGEAPLYHLYHPPQERLSRTIGSLDGIALRRRYRAAMSDPEAMRALLAEARAAVVT